MTANRSLSSLKASQLKHVAKCIGLATTGTKPELTGAIVQAMQKNRPFSKPPMIVSVDMGIKNLAICVLEAPYLASIHNAQYPTPTRLKILAWKKLDLLNQTDPAPNETSDANSDKTKPDSKLFLPQNLSKIALTISKNILHIYSPSHILIERQRFRTGSGAAVQEWTLRVNMLESMIWASLQTLRAVHSELSGLAKGSVKTFPDVMGVSPAKVAQFWCAGEGQRGSVLDAKVFEDGETTESPTKGVVQKSDKINLVRSWLSTNNVDNSSATDVQLQLDGDAQEIVNAFKGENRKTRKKDSVQRKLDDLADCLLQGAAWARWEENRRRLTRLLDLQS